MKRRLATRHAALRIIAGAAACLSPLVAATTCSRTTLGLDSGSIQSSSDGVTVTFDLKAVAKPILSGKDPLHYNGQSGEALFGISASATPFASTASSATYSVPAGQVTSRIGGVTSVNAVPWNLTITLGGTADTLALSGPAGSPAPPGTASTLTISLATGSWTTSVLKNPAPFSPSQQSVTEPASTVAYSVGCIAGIAAGSDFFQTANGTFVNIMGPHYPLTGVPISPATLGSADTIMQRSADGVVPADAVGTVSATGPRTADPDPIFVVPITLSALSLTGTFTSGCTMNITVQGSPASTGSMTLTQETNTGGTYTATFNVFWTATFTPASCHGPISGQCPMRSKGLGHWSTIPLPGETLVQGVYPDPNANQHSGLPPGYVDFYATAPQTDTGRSATHAVCTALASLGTPCS